MFNHHGLLIHVCYDSSSTAAGKSRLAIARGKAAYASARIDKY